jgi:DNA-binding IclR family transcriptional regulator
MSKGKYYFSKSLEKGLKILALFNRETPVFTQTEIARTLELNMTSAYRYINTLVELGYLEKNPKSREIRPSVQCSLFCSGLLQATDHMRMVKDIVDRIHREHNISIDVAIAMDDSMVRLYHREARETLTYRLPDSTKNCLHNTASGKAYLASLTDAEIEQKVAKMVLVSRTPRTIIAKKALLAELERIRRQRYAISDQEYLPGLVSIGAPLIDPVKGNGIGAVSFDFSVIGHNVKDIEATFGVIIRKTAQRISALLLSEDNGALSRAG